MEQTATAKKGIFTIQPTVEEWNLHWNTWETFKWEDVFNINFVMTKELNSSGMTHYHIAFETKLTTSTDSFRRNLMKVLPVLHKVGGKTFGYNLKWKSGSTDPYGYVMKHIQSVEAPELIRVYNLDENYLFAERAKYLDSLERHERENEHIMILSDRELYNFLITQDLADPFEEVNEQCIVRRLIRMHRYYRSTASLNHALRILEDWRERLRTRIAERMTSNLEHGHEF